MNLQTEFLYLIARWQRCFKNFTSNDAVRVCDFLFLTTNFNSLLSLLAVFFNSFRLALCYYLVSFISATVQLLLVDYFCF